MTLPVLGAVKAEETQARGKRLNLSVGQASHPGRRMTRNEDASFALQFAFAPGGQPLFHVGLLIIADGLGGQSSGEMASESAVRLAAEHVIRRLCLPLMGDGRDSSGSPPIHEILDTSFEIAHDAVKRRLPGAGTTMTMALVLDENVYIAHVSDSRAYRGTGGTIQALTQDHSMAARLVEVGHARPEDVADQRSVLYKALGQGARPTPDIHHHVLGPGEYALLCTDGLWNELGDQQIAETIRSSSSTQHGCDALVAKANKEGGDDNITVILIARDRRTDEYAPANAIGISSKREEGPEPMSPA